MEEKLAKLDVEAVQHKNKNLVKKSFQGLHIIMNIKKEKELNATQFHMKYYQKV